MARSKSPIKIITSLERTVKPPYKDYPVDAVVPGWDAIPGMAQHAQRISAAQPMRSKNMGHDPDHPSAPSNHPKP